MESPSSNPPSNPPPASPCPPTQPSPDKLPTPGPPIDVNCVFGAKCELKFEFKTRCELLFSGFIRQSSLSRGVPTDIEASIRTWIFNMDDGYIMDVNHIRYISRGFRLGDARLFGIKIHSFIAKIGNISGYKFECKNWNTFTRNSISTQTITVSASNIFDKDDNGNFITFVKIPLKNVWRMLLFQVSAMDNDNKAIIQSSWIQMDGAKYPPPNPMDSRFQSIPPSIFTNKIANGSSFITLDKWLDGLKRNGICNDENALDYKELFYYAHYCRNKGKNPKPPLIIHAEDWTKISTQIVEDKYRRIIQKIKDTLYPESERRAYSMPIPAGPPRPPPLPTHPSPLPTSGPRSIVPSSSTVTSPPPFPPPPALPQPGPEIDINRVFGVKCELKFAFKTRCELLFSGFIRQLSLSRYVPNDIETSIWAWIFDMDDGYIMSVNHIKLIFTSRARLFGIKIHSFMAKIGNISGYKFECKNFNKFNKFASTTTTVSRSSSDILDQGHNGNYITFMEINLKNIWGMWLFQVSALGNNDNIIVQSSWIEMDGGKYPPPIPGDTRFRSIPSSKFTNKIANGGHFVNLDEWLDGLKRNGICDNDNELDYKELFYYSQYCKYKDKKHKPPSIMNAEDFTKMTTQVVEDKYRNMIKHIKDTLYPASEQGPPPYPPGPPRPPPVPRSPPRRRVAKLPTSGPDIDINRVFGSKCELKPPFKKRMGLLISGFIRELSLTPVVSKETERIISSEIIDMKNCYALDINYISLKLNDLSRLFGIKINSFIAKIANISKYRFEYKCLNQGNPSKATQIFTTTATVASDHIFDTDNNGNFIAFVEIKPRKTYAMFSYQVSTIDNTGDITLQSQWNQINGNKPPMPPRPPLSSIPFVKKIANGKDSVNLDQFLNGLKRNGICSDENALDYKELFYYTKHLELQYKGQEIHETKEFMLGSSDWAKITGYNFEDKYAKMQLKIKYKLYPRGSFLPSSGPPRPPSIPLSITAPTQIDPPPFPSSEAKLPTPGPGADINRVYGTKCELKSLFKRRIDLLISGFIRQLSLTYMVSKDIETSFSSWIVDKEDKYIMDTNHVKLMHPSRLFEIRIHPLIAKIGNISGYKFECRYLKKSWRNPSVKQLSTIQVSISRDDIFDTDNNSSLLSFIEIKFYTDPWVEFSYQVSAVDDNGDVIVQSLWTQINGNKPPRPPFFPLSSTIFTNKITNGKGAVNLNQWLDALKRNGICSDKNILDYKGLFYCSQYLKFKEKNRPKAHPSLPLIMDQEDWSRITGAVFKDKYGEMLKKIRHTLHTSVPPRIPSVPMAPMAPIASPSRSVPRGPPPHPPSVSSTVRSQPSQPSISKIQIITIEEGNGKLPSAKSAVDIEYKGYLLKNNKHFISHREIIQMGLKQNIKGLEVALVKIKVGSKIRLMIPSRLAYGKKGAGSLIPPNADLTFELTLHGIVTNNKKEKEKLSMNTIIERKKAIELSQLKFIRKQRMLSVYGYIRNMEKSLSISIPSGLIGYVVLFYGNPNFEINTIKQGNGEVPGENSAVEIEYTGYLLPDNKQFIKHREVIQLGKRQNIKGLEKALVKIKVGSKVELYIASRWAYGKRGAGKIIPADCDLKFDLTLHKIVKK